MHFAAGAAIIGGVLGAGGLGTLVVPGMGSPYIAIAILYSVVLAVFIRKAGNGRQNTIGMMGSVACAAALCVANVQAAQSRLAADMESSDASVGVDSIIESALSNMTIEAWVVYAACIVICWTVSYKGHRA